MRSGHAGVILPLSAAPSSTGWGIGELPDVGRVAGWLAAAGFDRLMLLPLGPSSDGTASPYSTASLMALAPWYIALPRVAEFREVGGTSALTSRTRRRLDAARRSPRVDYGAVEQVKREALTLAFRRFDRNHGDERSTRGRAFADYARDHAWWLDDYALFQALREARPGVSWRRWPAALRNRQPAALAEAAVSLARVVRRHKYWQWLADGQWRKSRDRARAAGVQVVGDLPFAAGTESADVWARAVEHRFGGSIGAPPDAFNRRGQRWGLPPYRWDRVAASDYEVVRLRAKRMADLYDGFRIDHAVGWYRMYVRPRSGRPAYEPPRRAAQLRQGERVIQILKDSGAALIAEDLGKVPSFVRESLTALGVPGCKVIRWERDRQRRGRPFIDPRTFPAASVTMTGTHDTETLAGWWDGAPTRERRALLALPAMRDRGVSPADPWSDAVRDALLGLAWTSGSDDVYVMVQDLFGWRDRINTPGTVGPDNWTWRRRSPFPQIPRRRGQSST